MLWQQALAAGKIRRWPNGWPPQESWHCAIGTRIQGLLALRNKATTAKCSPFLQWRINDYRRGKLHFPPEIARVTKAKTYAAE